MIEISFIENNKVKSKKVPLNQIVEIKKLFNFPNAAAVVVLTTGERITTVHGYTDLLKKTKKEAGSSANESSH
ncbi:hypothetical protein I6N96_09060 [Enterococcus sp. BWM-S5]|uniref:Uncharacterized protein n=1 Tax=Enterococcus larvae TaxID=2794352 RepID=A0ABS4CKH2_9ENTE|nr:hypothetical protein [Enterococcus larvae]MBP1046432.1 hypothetical protein [Enterococcus larvae]